MTKLDTPRQTALSGITAHKGAADKREGLLREELNRQTRALRIDLARRVIDAMQDGVPQARISREGLGYNHANGVRSYFSLPMSGDVVGLLEEYIQRATGGVTLDVPAAERTATVIYDSGEGKGGNHLWTLERPDGEKIVLRHSKEFGEVRAPEIKAGAVLTSEEEGLIIGAGLKKSQWTWLTTEERDALWTNGE